MGRDEAKAMGLVHRSRAIQKRLVAAFEGEWLKEMGDGVMCSFPSASDAVYCALEIQEKLFKCEDLQLRIGIHLGEVLVEDGDIFSDGVNIAARLQAIAEPGGIYLSESVQKAIRGQKDIHTVYLGELQLKNVDYAVKTYALRGEGLPPVLNGAAKRLSGRVWAEVKRRNLHRAGVAYLFTAGLLITLTQFIPLLEVFQAELIGLLSVGFVVAMCMAWHYERGPTGIIRTSSIEAWENPFSNPQKKPFTSNLAILGLILILLGLNAFTLVERKSKRRLAEAPITSIAVLPFHNLSPDQGQQLFADGIQDEILSELSKSLLLDVKSRTSTLRYRHSENKGVKEIGKELQVAHLLEGSIRKIGSTVRVTAQLIEVTSDTHVWSGVYERKITSPLLIQKELARSISIMIKKQISDTIFDSPSLVAS